MLKIEKREVKKFMFEFDGKQYGITAFQSLSGDKLRELTRIVTTTDTAEQKNLFMALLLEVMEKDAPEALAKMDIYQIGELLGAYMQDGAPGETPGE